MATKAKKKATPKQIAARKKFATKAKAASKLIKSGKAKNMKQAFKMI
jgi:hypothetical protein